MRPASNTTVGEVSGELTEHKSFIDFDPEFDVDLDLHGSGCWTAIAVLAVVIIIIFMAIAIFPRLKARRLKKKAAKEELALQLSSLAKQNEEQKAQAEQELALLKEASDRRLRSLSVELDQLRGETYAVVA